MQELIKTELKYLSNPKYYGSDSQIESEKIIIRMAFKDYGVEIRNRESIEEFYKRTLSIYDHHIHEKNYWYWGKDTLEHFAKLPMTERQKEINTFVQNECDLEKGEEWENLAIDLMEQSTDFYTINDTFGTCNHCGNEIEDLDRADSNFCSYNCETLNILY